MRSSIAALAFAAAASASSQWHGGHGKNWDWNGGYPHRGWGGGGMHLPGSPPVYEGYKNATFKQLIDHSNPRLGTFDQFYFYDFKYWKPGNPIILFTPGEVNVTRYYTYLSASTNRTTGVVAEKIGAATIVLEHRYWGQSSPFADLTTENMRYLTLDNALKDMTYFANHVQLPFARHVRTNAKDVPWVTMGGSYSGSMSAWLAAVESGTFWAYHASSAPVQTISDYWSYLLPVQQGMPQNCSKDVSLVMDYMDGVFLNGTDEEITALKTKFGLESVEHNDDVMNAVSGGASLWQGNQFYTNSGFFTWCDYIENSVNKTGTAVAGPDGVGLEKALAGFATWWNEVAFPDYCASYPYPEFEGTYNTLCLNTYNASNPLYTDTSLGNFVDRQWTWMLCNEPFGWWQVGAPEDRPTIVSRLVTPEYYIRQCGLYFPPGPNGETYGIAKGKTEDEFNARVGGWYIDNTTRLIYVNGQYDPWREAGVSSDLRPGGPLQSTEQVPVEIVPGGFHTSDLITQNGVVNAGVQAVQDKIVEQLAAWVAEWPGKTPGGYGPGHGHHWKA